jgi:hypothetical protein
MAKKPIGKVVSALKMFSSTVVALNLTDSLSVGDKVTFDGWQEGLSIVVEKLTQSHKNVTTAVPGTAGIVVSSSIFIPTGSSIYKITEDQPANGGQTADTNAPSQGQQGPEVIPIAFGAGVAGSAQQPQAQAPNNEGNQQAQQNSGAVVSNIGIRSLFEPNFSANSLINASNAAQSINLPTTATEFLKYTPSYAAKIKSKTMSYWLWYVLIALVLIAPISVLGLIYQNAPTIPLPLILITFFAEFLISGAILLYLGFKDFSFEQFLASIPVVKVDVATYNLNKMQGKFIPYNAEPLKAPISGAECVYYSVGLYAAFYEGYGRNRHLVVQWIGGIGKGVPTLFSDDSGYLAVDLVKAPNVQVTSSALELNKAGIGASVLRELSGSLAYIKQGKEAAAEIMPHIEEAANSNNTVDLSQISGFKFNLRFKNRIRDLKGNITNDIHLNLLQNFGLFLVEQYIPVNSDYTCLSGAADINKSIEGKPVKVMVPDQGKGTMAVYAGAAQNVKKGMSKRTLLNMAIGILFIIGALGLLSFYFSSASAASAANVATSVATSIVTTVVPSQSPGYQSNSTQSTSITTSVQSTTVLPPPNPSSVPSGSCGNFTLSEPAFSSTTSGVCSWNGGTINVSAGGGLSGYISVQIVGADGKEYFNKVTVNWCPANIGSVYLPAQKYEVYISSGGGGGGCGSNPNAVATLSS